MRCPPYGLLLVQKTSAPRTWLTPLNTSPATSPVNASRHPSRTDVHHSGPVRLATPYTVADFHRLPSAGLPAHPGHPINGSQLVYRSLRRPSCTNARLGRRILTQIGALVTVKAMPTAPSPSAEKAQPNADRTSSIRRLYASRNTGIGSVSKSASAFSKKAAKYWACRRATGAGSMSFWPHKCVSFLADKSKLSAENGR